MPHDSAISHVKQVLHRAKTSRQFCGVFAGPEAIHLVRDWDHPGGRQEV